jgi:hypothetical protein
MKLYEIYAAPPMDFLRMRFEQIILPTEVVLRNLTPPLPLFARVYDTQFWAMRETKPTADSLLPAPVSKVLIHSSKGRPGRCLCITQNGVWCRRWL